MTSKIEAKAEVEILAQETFQKVQQLQLLVDTEGILYQELV